MAFEKRSDSGSSLRCDRSAEGGCRNLKLEITPPTKTDLRDSQLRSKKDFIKRPSLIRRILSQKVAPNGITEPHHKDKDPPGEFISSSSGTASVRNTNTHYAKSETSAINLDSANVDGYRDTSNNFSPLTSICTTGTPPGAMETLSESNKSYYNSIAESNLVSSDNFLKLLLRYTHKYDKRKDFCPNALLLAAPISYLKNYATPLWGLLYYSELVIYSKRPGFLGNINAGEFSGYFSSSHNACSSPISPSESKTDIIIRVPTKLCAAICYKQCKFEVVFSGGSMCFYLKSNADVVSWVSIINSVSAHTNLYLCRNGCSKPIDFKYNRLVRILTRKLARSRELLNTDELRGQNAVSGWTPDNVKLGECLQSQNDRNAKTPGSSDGVTNRGHVRLLPDIKATLQHINLSQTSSIRSLSGRFNEENSHHIFVKTVISIILNSPDKNWYELCSILFMIYRIVMEPVDLMGLLRYMFCYGSSDINTRLMLVWMIHFWFEGFSKDDFSDVGIRAELLKLISALKSHCLFLDSPICSEQGSCVGYFAKDISLYNLELKDLSIPLRILEITVEIQGKQYDKHPSPTTELADSSLINHPRLFDESSDFLTLDVRKLAECITIGDYMLIASVTTISFLTYAQHSNTANWYNELPEKSDMRLLTDSFNKISYWVSTEVCFFADIKIRAQTIEKCIQLASELYKLRNYNSLMAVVSGLNSSSVRRMKMTWSRVKNKFLYKLYKLERFLHPKMNFSKYRQVLRLRENTIKIISYVQDALKGKVVETSKDTAGEDQNIEQTKSKNSCFKPLFCCISGYRKGNGLFTSDDEFKERFFFAKAVGGYPILSLNICKRDAIVPIFFLFIKDLVFAITRCSIENGADSSITKYTNCVEIARILANFSQTPAGIVPKRLVSTYNDIKPYMESSSQNNSILGYRKSIASKPHICKEYVFLKDLFWLKESCLERISHLHEAGEPRACPQDSNYNE